MEQEIVRIEVRDELGRPAMERRCSPEPAAHRVVMLVMLTHNWLGIDRRRSPCAMASESNTAVGRTACSRHRRWRRVRRYDATRSSRPLPLRMDLWTKSRLRILFGVIGRTAVQQGQPRGGDPELPVARGPRDRIHRVGRTHLPPSERARTRWPKTRARTDNRTFRKSGHVSVRCGSIGAGGVAVDAPLPRGQLSRRAGA